MLNDLAIIVISVHLKSSWNLRKESINSLSRLWSLGNPKPCISVVYKKKTLHRARIVPTQRAYLRRTLYASVLYSGCLPDVTQSIGVST